MASVRAGGRLWTNRAQCSESDVQTSLVGTGGHACTGSEVAPARCLQVTGCSLWWALPALEEAHSGWVRRSRQWEGMRVREANKQECGKGWKGKGGWAKARAAERARRHTDPGEPPSARDVQWGPGQQGSQRGVVSERLVHRPSPCSLKPPTPSSQARAWGVLPLLCQPCRGVQDGWAPASSLPRPRLWHPVWPASQPPSQSWSHLFQAQGDQALPCSTPFWFSSSPSPPPLDQATSYSGTFPRPASCVPTLPEGSRWAEAGLRG